MTSTPSWEDLKAKLTPKSLTYAQARAIAALPFVPSLNALREFVRDGEWPQDGRNGTTPDPTGGPAAPSDPNPVDAPRDPVLQALLQQLEYTKPGASTPGKQVGTVTALPGGGGGNSSGPLILVVVVVVAGGFFLLKKKKGHSGGATHVEG